MATKLYTEDIDKTINWGGDEKTNGLPVSGEKVQKFIKESLAKKFGYIYYDKNVLSNDAGVGQTLTGTNQYIIFADEDDFNEWLASGGSDNTLVRGRFDAPAPAIIEISDQSKQVNTILSSEVAKQKISFSYLVKDSSNKIQPSRMSIAIQISNNVTGMKTVPTQTLDLVYSDQPIPYSFDTIGDYLSEGTNTITITVTSLQYNVSTTVTYQYKVLNLMLSSTFDDPGSDFYYYNGISLTDNEYFGTTLTAQGTGAKYLRVYIDGVNLDGAEVEGSDKPSRYIGSNTPQSYDLNFQFKDQNGEYKEWATAGKHSLQFYFFVLNEAGEEIKSQTLYYDIVFTEPGMQRGSYILFSRTLEQGELVEAGSTLQLATEQYEDISIEYAVFDTSGCGNNEDGSAVIVELKLTNNESGDVIASPLAAVPSASKSTFSYTFNEYGDITLTITNTVKNAAGGQLGEIVNIPVNVAKSSVQIEEASANLVLKLSALNRSNSEPESTRTTWEYSFTPAGTTITTSYKAIFDNVLWNNQNGWIDNCLVLNNGATVTIPINIFNQFSGGLTFEIDFETANVQDDDASIMKYGSENGAHIFINACNAELQSNGKVNIHTNFKENSRQKIQFIFNGNSYNSNEDALRAESPYLMYLVVNGILDRAAQFSPTDSLGTNSPENFVIGNMDGKATIKIHSIRIYRRALTLDECVDNYIADSGAIRQKYLKNDVYNEGSKTINVDNILNSNIHIPVMTIFGNITDSIVMRFDKKANVPIDVLYQDPEYPEFDFFAHDCWMSNQGTSSMNYPRRNLRLYLNKQADSKTLRGYAPNHAYLYQSLIWHGLTDATTIEQIQTGQIDVLKPIQVGDQTYYAMGNKKWTEEDGSTNKKKYDVCCCPVTAEEARWLWHSGIDLFTCKEVLKNPDDPSEGTKKEWTKIKNYQAEVDKGSQLYSYGGWARFKTKDLYTDRWTIKCDYAESSMTHNAGVGRLWGDVMRDVEIGDGGFRYDTAGNKITSSNPGITNAQAAVKQYKADTGKEYGDIRTSCDGKPIIIVNRPRLKDESGNYTGRFGEPVFLGLYNIMTDKGSTPLFGFENLRNDDNTLIYDAGNEIQRTECWECLQNGSDLAQMSTIVTDTNDKDGNGAIATTNENRLIWATYEARWPDNDDLNDTKTNQLETVIRFVNFCKDAVSVKVGNPDNAKDGYTLSDFTAITEDQAEYYSEHLDEVANETLYIGVPKTSYKDKSDGFYRKVDGKVQYDDNGIALLLRMDNEDEYAEMVKLVNKNIYYYQTYAAQNVTGQSFAPLYDASASVDAKISSVLGQLNSNAPQVFTASEDYSEIEYVEQVYYPNSGYDWYIFDNTYDRSIVTKTVNTETLKDDIYTGKVYTFDGKRVDNNGEQLYPEAWVNVYLTKSGNKYTYTNEFGEEGTNYASGEDIITEVGSGNTVTRGASFKGHTLMEYFTDKKYEHFDVWKLAAYYVYIMRFAAVDQVIKNTMMTTEDGKHYYFINYDNDTVMGVRNDGYLAYDWQITRETYDYSVGSYAYAGFGSTLWNLLEQDADFMDKVQTMATAMVTSNVLTYDIAIDMFNNKQAGTWSERLYNNSEMYKYIGTFNDLDNRGTAAYNPYQNTKYLPFLQGSRASHRDWWLRHRFDLYDSKWSAGEYATNALEFYMGLTASTSNKKNFLRMVPGSRFYYTIQSNNRTLGNNFVELSPELDEHGNEKSHYFETSETLILGNPMKMLGAYKVKVLDFSEYRDSLGSSMNFNWDKSKGSMMTELILGGPKTLEQQNGCALQVISNLDRLESLEVLDIRTCYNLSSTPDISNLGNLKKFLASDSNITNFLPAKGLNLEEVSLPSSIQNIVLDSINIAQPTEEEIEAGITTKFKYEPNTALTHVELLDCTGIDIIDFLNTWYKDLKRYNVMMTNYSCVLSFDTIELPAEIDGVDSLTWFNTLRKEFGKNTNGEDNFKIKKGIVKLYGHAVDQNGDPTGGLTQEDYEELLKYWPQSCFESGQAFHFDANKSIFITVKSDSSRFKFNEEEEDYEIVSGQSVNINVTIFPANNDRVIKLVPATYNPQTGKYIGGQTGGWSENNGRYTSNFGQAGAYTYLTNDNGISTLTTAEYSDGSRKKIQISVQDSLDPLSANQNKIYIDIVDIVLPNSLVIYNDETGNVITGLNQEITDINKEYIYRVEFSNKDSVNVDVKSIGATFGNTNISESENGRLEGYIGEDGQMYVKYLPKINKGETANTSFNIQVNVTMNDRLSTVITRNRNIPVTVKTNNIESIVLKLNNEEVNKVDGKYYIRNYIRNLNGEQTLTYHYDVEINPSDFNVVIQTMELDTSGSTSPYCQPDNITKDPITNAIIGFDIVVSLSRKRTMVEAGDMVINLIATDSNGNTIKEISQEIDWVIACYYPDEIRLVKNENNQGWEGDYINVDLLNGEDKNVNFEAHVYSVVNGELYYWSNDPEPTDDINSIKFNADGRTHFLTSDQYPIYTTSNLQIDEVTEEGQPVEYNAAELVIQNGTFNIQGNKFSFVTIDSGTHTVYFKVTYKVMFNGKPGAADQPQLNSIFAVSRSAASESQGRWQNLEVDIENIENNFYYLDNKMRIYKGSNLGQVDTQGKDSLEDVITAVLYIYYDNNSNKQVISIDPWLLKQNKTYYWWKANSTFAIDQQDGINICVNPKPNQTSAGYNLFFNLLGYNIGNMYGNNNKEYSQITYAERFEAMYDMYAFVTAKSNESNPAADGGTFEVINNQSGQLVRIDNVKTAVENIGNGVYTLNKISTDNNMIFMIFDYYKNKYGMNVNGRILSTEELTIIYSNFDAFANALFKVDSYNTNVDFWKELLYSNELFYIDDSVQRYNYYNDTNDASHNIGRNEFMLNLHVTNDAKDLKVAKIFSTNNPWELGTVNEAKMPATDVTKNVVYNGGGSINSDEATLTVRGNQSGGQVRSNPTDKLYCFFTPCI